MVVLLLGMLSLSPLAWAQDDDDEFDFLEEGDKAAASKKASGVNAGDFSTYDAEDDEDLADFRLAQPTPPPEPEAPKAPPTRALPYAVEGKAPLADNYPAQVVATATGAVVVELPVLVAQQPADVSAEYWLVAEVWSGGKKVAESRQLVGPTTLAQTGASFVFVKLLAPVADSAGALELRVGRASSASGAPKALFTRKVEYKLGS